VSSSQDRFYAVDEINELIPALEAAFDRITELYEEATALAAELTTLGVDPTEAGDDEPPDVRGKRTRLRYLADAIQEHVHEIERSGGEVKDLSKGLVDFRTRRHGRTVYLCWRKGESEVRFWHDLEAGYQGRRPIADADEFGGTYLH
jgi:hypothetical protein